MFDKYIATNKKRTLLKKLIWAQMLGLTGASLPWQTFTGNPLQFNAEKAHTLRSTVVAFSPIQSGSGDPSPTNVRPISGWTAVTVTGAGENLWDDTATPTMIDCSPLERTRLNRHEKSSAMAVISMGMLSTQTGLSLVSFTFRRGKTNPLPKPKR